MKRLIISEGFKERFHRKYILKKDLRNFGCATGPHPKNAFMFVADYTVLFDALVPPSRQQAKID